MKRIFNLLIVFLLVLFVGSNAALADDVGFIMNEEEVPNSSYVIGEYLFTRNTNELYNGQLNTRAIMLAAKTVYGRSVDDMIIYYKNAHGVWVDALSGEQIVVPQGFDIFTTDLLADLQQVSFDTEVLGDDEDYYPVEFDISTFLHADGVALFVSDDEYPTSLDDYELVSSINGGIFPRESEYMYDYSLILNIPHSVLPANTQRKFTLVLYQEMPNGEKRFGSVYDYVTLGSLSPAPLVNINESVYLPAGITEQDGSGYLQIDVTLPYSYINADNAELYASESQSGPFVKKGTCTKIDNSHFSCNTFIENGKYYYYKARTYVVNNDTNNYSYYSEVIYYDNSIDVPVISSVGSGDGDASSSYLITLQNYQTTENIQGVIIEKRIGNNGAWERVDNYQSSEINDTHDVTGYYGMELGVPHGYNQYYRVKYYHIENGEVVTSNPSNVINIDTSSETSWMGNLDSALVEAYPYDDNPFDINCEFDTMLTYTCHIGFALPYSEIMEYGRFKINIPDTIVYYGSSSNIIKQGDYYYYNLDKAVSSANDFAQIQFRVNGQSNIVEFSLNSITYKGFDPYSEPFTEYFYNINVNVTNVVTW